MIPGYAECNTTPPEEPELVKEKLNGSGYVSTSTSVFVPEEDAFDYALERVGQGAAQERKEFVDWFYSGCWIKE